MPKKLTQEEFEEKVITLYGKDTYILTNTVYKSSREPITIKCKKHGEFTQKAGIFLEGHGCQKCGRKKGAEKRTKNTEEFIKEANKIHKNKYSYKKTEYVSCDEKVIITCNIPGHGDFQQTPKQHLLGHGCDKCASIYRGNLIKDTRETFIEKGNEKHGEGTYDYSKVVYVDSQTKVIIICNIPGHGEFQQTPNSHIGGSGCPKCGRLKTINALKERVYVSPDPKILHKIFIEKGNEKYGEGTYDYSKVVYINSETKVIIICKLHGEFRQKPAGHLRGGCWKCGIMIRSDSKRDNFETFYEKSFKRFGNKFNYSRVKYVNSSTKVIIICPHHGEFKQTPNKHITSKHGCLKCGIQASADAKLKSFEDFVKDARIIHGDFYTYVEETYEMRHEKTTIICPKHGAFEQKPVNHIKGSGCARCSSNGYSHVQIIILDFFAKLWKIDIQHAENGGEFIVDGKKVDGYNKEKNIVFEVHGDFWHGNPLLYPQDEINPVAKKTYGFLYKKTKEKDENIKKAGYNLKIIWVITDWYRVNKAVIKIQKLFKEKHNSSIK